MLPLQTVLPPTRRVFNLAAGRLSGQVTVRSISRTGSEDRLVSTQEKERSENAIGPELTIQAGVGVKVGVSVGVGVEVGEGVSVGVGPVGVIVMVGDSVGVGVLVGVWVGPS